MAAVRQTMGMDCAEIAPVLGAIGNHEELTGGPVSAMSAALIIADKSDVHYSRVQNPVPESYDIHDRVNSAVRKSRVELDKESRRIALELEIEPQQQTVHAAVVVRVAITEPAALE